MDNEAIGRLNELPEIRLADLDRDPEMERLQYASLSARIKLSFSDMRQAVRILLDEKPSEPRLLFFVLMSDVIFFLNFGLKFVISPTEQVQSSVPEEFAGALGGLITVAFLLRTMTLYGVSAVTCFVCRLFGGKGDWRETRTGIFWASLVAAPIGLLGALCVVGLEYLAVIDPIFLQPMFMMPAQLIGMVAFVFFVSATVAESHGFRNTSPIFIIFSLVTIAFVVATLYLQQQVVQAL
ncbi:MAG: YIP1 family protein [Pseudomonadota bacterium]